MKTKQLKMIRNIILVATIVIGFAIWLALPNEFKNSSFLHVGTGEYASKTGVLIMLLLPFLTFLPDLGADKDIHTDDPAERESILEDRAKSDAKRQVLVSSLLAVIVIGVLGISALTL